MTDEVMQKLDDAHPLNVAWKAYTSTEKYTNSIKWAGTVVITKYGQIGGPPLLQIEQPHIEGSMWSAFLAGWAAAKGGVI